MLTEVKIVWVSPAHVLFPSAVLALTINRRN